MTYILATSVILAWLYNSTQASLPIVILVHAAFNTFTKFFLSGLQGSHYIVAWWTLAGLVALLAVAVVAVALAVRTPALPEGAEGGPGH